VSFATIIFCIASHQVLLVVVYFTIDSVRKLLDTALCMYIIPPSLCIWMEVFKSK